jgi:hypothetical protein
MNQMSDRVPPSGVAGAWARRFRAGPGWLDDHCRQSDDGIIAQGGHGFQRHVAGALDRPFAILLQKDRADEPDDGLVIWKDADDLGAPLTAHRIMPTTPLASPSAWPRAQAEDVGARVHSSGYHLQGAESGSANWKKMLVVPAVVSGDRTVRPSVVELPRNETGAKLN